MLVRANERPLICPHCADICGASERARGRRVHWLTPIGGLAVPQLGHARARRQQQPWSSLDAFGDRMHYSVVEATQSAAIVNFSSTTRQNDYPSQRKDSIITCESLLPAHEVKTINTGSQAPLKTIQTSRTSGNHADMATIKQ